MLIIRNNCLSSFHSSWHEVRYEPMIDEVTLKKNSFVQNAIMSIAKVEEAYKCESRCKAVIEETIQLLSVDELHDDMDAAEDVDENRLLPAVNKLWPYLVICLGNKISVVQFLACC
jgi:hypothetical protein